MLDGLHTAGSFCLGDLISLWLLERALKGRDAKREEGASDGTTPIRTVNSLISLLRLIREIFSICVDLREAATIKQ